MRILWLTPQPPTPLEDGLNIRLRHLWEGLATRHSLWILYLQEEPTPNPAAAARLPCIAATAIPIQGTNGRAYRHCQDHSPEVDRGIRRFLDATPVDIVVASSIWMVPYVQHLAGLPVVIDLVDAMSLLTYREIKGARTLPGKLRALRTWWGYRRYERRHFRSLRDLVLSSDVDARVVRSRAAQANVVVIPNGVDSEYFRPQPPETESKELVFSGVMSFSPNHAAVMHFYSEILPRIWHVHPDLRFTVVGKSPPEELYRLTRGDPRVRITGYVPDIRPYLGRATAYVAPMISGAGIKNKILEAFAMAKPVVATSLACDGLHVRSGETLLVADGPESFARAVSAFLADPELRARVGRQARAHVLQHYTWRQQAERFGELLELVGRRAGRLQPAPDGFASAVDSKRKARR